MHLRFEPRLIYAIAMTPLLLFIWLMPVPDIVLGR
jgi:hypothetical protein